MFKHSLLVVSMAAVLLAGCRNKEASEDAAPVAKTAAAPAPAAATTEPVPAPVAAAAPVATAFDINTITVSDAPLGEWPYLALPAGYAFASEDRADRIKDLARVPFWTGSQLLWVEGRTFEDQIVTADGKTFSQFELLKGLDAALTGLGAVKIADNGIDQPTYEAARAELQPFTSEFDRVDDAYFYGEPTKTYVIRRADKAIWFTVLGKNENAVVLVAESPVPPPAK